MRNRYPGTCCYCHGHVGEGEGHCEKRDSDRRWRVFHAACRDRAEARGAVRDANCRTHTAECRNRKAEYAATEAPAEELARRLKGHDWYADFSDDGAVRRRAHENMTKIKELAAKVPPTVANKLWDEHAPKDLRRPLVKDERPGAPNPFDAESAESFLLDMEYQMCAAEELTAYGYGLDELFELAKAAAVKGGCPAAMGAPERECRRWNAAGGTCDSCVALGLGNPGPAVSLRLVEAM